MSRRKTRRHLETTPGSVRRAPLREGYCATGKMRYPNEFEAEIALLSARRNREMQGSERVETRHYYCPACRGHHLTSRPPKEKTS